jgi:hypothetical protein
MASARRLLRTESKYAGIATIASTATMATVIISSISVNPRRAWGNTDDALHCVLMRGLFTRHRLGS